ncbi:hypothetical protein F9U64_06455 [Gracilibacillus oryzae]|uniref:Uncharacterized protein n=1 Tax=Gracilibacillus oryzae TaxID=1672701 RepID=A0A7C8KV85_9BACI|nr:hypothetical protein [Gracilibacillus oryzae]KAB8138083.1 hypothetical protein F9U64_06455 [Gracilibacillus oryzae]
MGHLLPTLLHFLMGVCICFLLFNQEIRSKKKRFIIFLFGGTCAIAPDIPKYFGDFFGHSILAVPLFGLLFSAVFYIFIKEFSLLKTWLIFFYNCIVWTNTNRLSWKRGSISLSVYKKGD